MESKIFLIVDDKRESKWLLTQIEEIVKSRLTDCTLHHVRVASKEEFNTNLLFEEMKRSTNPIYTLIIPWHSNYDEIHSCFVTNCKDNQHKFRSPFSLIDPLPFADACTLGLENILYKHAIADISFSHTDAAQIQPKSFAYIETRLRKTSYNTKERSILSRIIHSTADFSLEHDFYITDTAAEMGIAALRKGAKIIVDVRMVAAGIGTLFKNRTEIAVAHPNAKDKAQAMGLTRSAAGVECLKHKLAGSIVVIGNAPTALMQILRLGHNKVYQPALVVGCPVGFVGAAESKEELVRSGLPCICIRGNRGGSSIAAAAINALGQWL